MEETSITPSSNAAWQRTLLEKYAVVDPQYTYMPPEVTLAHNLSKDSVGRKAAVLTTAALPVIGLMAVGRAVKEWTAWNILGKRW